MVEEMKRIIEIDLDLTNANLGSNETTNTGKVFWTTDVGTSLLRFSTTEDITNSTASLVLKNISDGSVVQRNIDVLFNHFTYLLREDEIQRAGNWIGQIVVEKDGKALTSRSFKFTIKGSLLDTAEPALSDIENYQKFYKQLTDLETEFAEKLTNLETQYAPKLTEVTAQLAQTDIKKADKTHIWNMPNMGQDVKEAMTGGSVAVVGKNTVLTENIVDEQVTPKKTNFIELVEVGTDVVNISDQFTIPAILNIETGVTTENQAYRSTDFLSLENVKQLFRYANDGSSQALFTDFRSAFYSDKTSDSFISGTNRGTNYTIERYGELYGVYYDIPTGANYVRFTMGATNIPGGASSNYTYLMVKGVYKNRLLNAYNSLENGGSETLEPIVLKPLEGKQVVNLGDSIFGITRGENSVSNHIALRTGATVHNCGFGGTRAASHGSADFDVFSLYRLVVEIVKDNSDTSKWKLQDEVISRLKTVGIAGMPTYFEEQLHTLKTIDFSKVDYCTIAYGTNDFTGLIPISDSVDNEKTTTYEGALRYSLRLLMTKYKKLKILVCSPIYRYWMDVENNYTDDSDTRLFNGVLLTDFVSAGKEVSDEFKVPFSDNYHELGINKYNKELYFPETDGTHLNVAGNAKYGSKLGSDLITKY